MFWRVAIGASLLAAGLACVMLAWRVGA
jgi:hypothetical protein